MTAIAVRGCAVVPAPDPAALPAPLAERVGRVERLPALALAGAHAALADATRGGAAPVAGERAGVVLGTAFGCLLTNAEYQQRLAAGGTAAASPRLFAATVSNAAAGEVAIAFGLGGPGITLTAGGASGTVALGHAMAQLAAGRADVLLAGGVDATGPALHAWAAAAGFAPGAALADGATLLVLEAAAEAAAPPGASLLGHAAGFEPAPAPQRGEALAACVARALERAGVQTTAVDAVAIAGAPAELDWAEAAVGGVLGGRGSRAWRRHEGPWRLAAAGPAALAALLAAPAGRIALVADVCSTGHVATLVARTGGAP